MSADTNAKAFEHLRGELAIVTTATAPWTEPRPAALGALVAADFLTKPENGETLVVLAGAGQCSELCVDELRVAARAVLYLSTQIAAKRSPSGIDPGSLRQEAKMLAGSMADVIDRTLVGSDDARLWLDVFLHRSTDEELTLDLRNLARMYGMHAPSLSEACEDPAASATNALSLADALEVHCRGPRTEWDDWLARTWALFVPRYAEVCRVGRFIVSDAAERGMFPSLATTARARRRSRQRKLGHVGQRTHRPVAAPVRQKPPPLPPGASASAMADAEVAIPAPPSAAVPPLPAPPTLPTADVAPNANADFPHARPVLDFSSDVQAPSGTSGPEATDTNAAAPETSRSEVRHPVDLEVGIFGDSNFYVGFAEDLSNGGVFVATYVSKPLGSRVELSVRLPNRDEPLRVLGEVRWVRELSASADEWPGMGIRFEQLSAHDEAVIREFLSMREPLFFVE